MRNPPAAYKHDDPTHKQYGQSADSSLLAKRRQNFAGGGTAYREHLGSRAGATWVDEKGHEHVIPENYDTVTGWSEGVQNAAGRLDPSGKGLEHYNTYTGAVIPKDEMARAVAPAPAPRAAPAPQQSGPRLKTGRGTARVDLDENPGWPTM